MTIRGLYNISLIVLGTVGAALVALLVPVATNEQFLIWVRMQRWYSLQRTWIALAIVVFLCIVIAILQLLLASGPRPSPMKLVVGIFDPDRFVDRYQKADETSLLYLLDMPSKAVSIVYCMLRLSNVGDRGIKSVRIEVSYPREYLLDEGVSVPFEDAIAVVEVDPKAKEHQRNDRQVQIIGSTAHVNYDVEVLRYKETLVISEPLQIRHFDKFREASESAYRPAALARRLAQKNGFIDYLRMQVLVFTEESRLEDSFDIYSFAGSSEQDVDSAVDAIKEAIWNDTVPTGGVYFIPFSRRFRRSQLEFCLPRLIPDKRNRIYQARHMDYNGVGIAPLVLPPVNFRHTDDRYYMGNPIIRHPRRKERKTEFFTPKPPSS